MRRSTLVLSAVACSAALALAAGCRSRKGYIAPEEPMPPNTVLLSHMLRELSAQPGFNEKLLEELGGDQHGAKKGPALLTPALLDHLRKLILGKDWRGLDRFPGWTMREINPTVRTVGHFVGKDEKAEDVAAVHPGAPSGAHSEAASKSQSSLAQYLDLGPYALEKAETVDLTKPSPLPPFSLDGLVTDLGGGVQRGDGANPEIAPLHAQSQQLADVLNRLSLNGEPDAKPFIADIGSTNHIATPETMIGALVQTGHTVTVNDARYFANFGHFHYKGKDVMMPFWVNAQILVPGSNRPLLVPVAHAEYEWHIRGPHVNADVAWYFGIDGKAEFRTMDTLDQPWVQKRNAHTYTGADAQEVTRLIGRMTVAYMHLHQQYPSLPFGGYYALGVCQDGVAAIEKKMTGKATLFPNTADASLFDDARDAEINALIAAIPKDRAGKQPEPERIFGSLPVAADDASLRTIMIPGLADDLIDTHAAWTSGDLERTHGLIYRAARMAALGLCGVGFFALIVYGVRSGKKRTRAF